MRLRWPTVALWKALGVVESDDLQRNPDQLDVLQPTLLHGDGSELTPQLRAPASLIGGFSTPATAAGESAAFWIQATGGDGVQLDWINLWYQFDDTTASFRFAVVDDPLVSGGGRFVVFTPGAGTPAAGWQGTGQQASPIEGGGSKHVRWALGVASGATPPYADNVYDPTVFSAAQQRTFLPIPDIHIPQGKYFVGWHDTVSANHFAGFSARVWDRV